MAFDLTPELTEKDWECLNDFRLKRLQASFSVLESCKLQLSCLTNDLLLICDRETWHDLQDALVDVRMASWEIVGASNLSIFANGHLVYCAMTQLSETLATIEPTLESIALRLDSSMVTATAARAPKTTTPANAPMDTGVSTLPAFIDLMPLATKAGIPVERIAAEINSLGGVAGIDRTGTYITTDKDQRAWVKAYLQRLEADFLLSPTTAPTVEAESVAPKPKRQRTNAASNGKAATTVEAAAPKTPKFKDFNKAQSYSVTIGRFLDAQGWGESDPLRAQIFEGIAALPDDKLPSRSSESLAERALHKILSKYDSSKRFATLRGMIKVAKETIGVPTSNAEPELESTEV